MSLRGFGMKSFRENKRSDGLSFGHWPVWLGTDWREGDKDDNEKTMSAAAEERSPVPASDQILQGSRGSRVGQGEALLSE